MQSVFAKRNRETFNRVKGGLKIIAPETAIGVLVGSIAALLLPVLILIGSQISQFISAFPTTKSGQLLDPWLKTIAAPDRLTLIAVVSVFAFGYLVHEALWLFARRFYAWAIYEGTVLAAVCTFTIWIRSFWWALDAFGAGIFLVCVIAWTRFTPEDDEDHLINSDRPINHLSEDKLDRKKLIVSLVNRLLQDAAPVIALIGAYGDGKTSMLNLLDEQLQTEKVPVVRFKSSLPGDDLMLISTLFNSIGKQLRRRFFVRKLRNVLKRFARTFSGLVPYVPSGLKDVFAEPSQEDELVELTDRLDKLPVRRLVVLLDDMDRMQGSELRMLLKIIRAADDYPKLSFVCAFNKKALVDTLIRHQVTDRISMQFSTTGQATVKGTLSGEQMADDTRAGYEYLEKFFPVQVPVPKLDESQLAKEFDLRFNQFATRYGLSQAQKDTAAFDKEFNPYWKPLFRPSLSNLRKMNAYFNALNSSFGLVKDEVNVIDFMFVELLRQIDPETYEQVFRNRSLFYSPQWDLQRWDERFGMLGAEKEEEHYPKYDQMFRHLQGEERDLTLSLLGRLFPKVAKYDKNPLSFAATKLSENEADKQKRIYHPYYFMIYFSLHVPEGYFGAEELDKFIETANGKQSAAEAQKYFSDYIDQLQPAKRYRFFEKMSRSDTGLQPLQAKALAISVALASDKLEPGELDIGEFHDATILVLVLANHFKDTVEITQLLSDAITQSATDGFAIRLFQFASEQERNRIFERWDNVDASQLKSALEKRLKAKYYKGGTESIYSKGTWRDWQALLWWARNTEEGPAQVRAYLEDEFEKRPASIGKHVSFLWHSLENTDGRKIVDDLFPLARLAEIAKRHASTAQWTESEKRLLGEFIQKYGSSGTGSGPTPIVPS